MTASKHFLDNLPLHLEITDKQTHISGKHSDVAFDLSNDDAEILVQLANCYSAILDLVHLQSSGDYLADNNVKQCLSALTKTWNLPVIKVNI